MSNQIARDVFSAEHITHSTNEVEVLARYQRATNYLAAAQIYLQDNFLLRTPLRPEHIKDRLLGHWGTCPGINMSERLGHYQSLLTEHRRYIERHGTDPDHITRWRWS